MNDQTEMMLREGGLSGSDQTVEPTTGNEIPPGSLPHEVRDDVDAKLSEGEYVVPADVVRYYGVKFFEDLRSDAKSDMMDMQAEGRIGGTPVDDNGIPIEEQLTPEEKQMLQEAMSMQSEPKVGMAAGGVVNGIPANPYSFGNAYGQMSPYGSGQMEARQYINTSTGQVRSFQFLNGQPLSLIPQGFVPMTPEAKAQADQAQATQAATQGAGQATGQLQTEGGGIGDYSGDNVSGGSRGSRSSSGISGYVDVSDPLGMAESQLAGAGKTGGLAGFGLGLIAGNPMLGATVGKSVGTARDLGKVAENIETAELLGFNTKEAREDLSKALEGTKGLVGKGLAKSAVDAAKNRAEQNFYEALSTGDSGLELSRDSFQTDEAYSEALQGLARSVEEQGGYESGSVSAIGRDLGGFDAAEAHSEANPTGMSTGQGVSASEVAGMAPPGMDWGSDSVGSEGGGDGGGDGTVICTAFHNLGLIDSKVYTLDGKYAEILEITHPEILYGYRKLATPLAKYIQKDTLLAKTTRWAIHPLVKAWSKEMAHQMEPENYSPSFVGKFLMAVGYPICGLVGKTQKGSLNGV